MSIKSLDLLPEIFRSETNQKFLAATVDQLIAETETVKVESFIGRLDAPTLKAGDTYVSEPTTNRKNYQLETSVVATSPDGMIDFYSTYVDLLQQIAYHGGFTNDHSRLFTNESYNFNGLFDLDKFVNFTNYLWIPNGPPEVDVSATALPPFINEFSVARDLATNSYQFTGFGKDHNPILTLVKGNTYKFDVSQSGNPFWIQTKPGVTGAFSTEEQTLIRTIFGIENNGIDSGVITFAVPNSNAQDRGITATLAATVDFATSLSYNQIQSHLTNLITGGIDGVANSLNGKTLIFTNRDQSNDKWTDPGTFDTSGFDSDGFEYGLMVPGDIRYNVFQIQTLNVGGGRQVVKLIPSTVVNEGQKVFVRSGNTNSNVEFLKTSEGVFEPLHPATAPLTELYYQDDSNPNLFGTIKLVDPTTASIDIEKEILGRINYTSPNGVAFTNGMVVRFDNTVTPSNYATNAFVVEGVGRGIKLISVSNFLSPETYAISSALGAPDYITINRASQDLNAWSRSNRWFHIQTVEAAAKYRNNPTLLDIAQFQKAKRPIIEFEPNIFLFDYGRNSKSPVDIIDFTVKDAFNEVEGRLKYVVRLPNGKTQQLTPGTRIIFAGDMDPDVRRRIYRVEYVVTASGQFINLVSQTTQNLPVYEVSGSLVTSNVKYNFLPSVSFEAPLPAIGSTQATGRVVLDSTGIANISMVYSGINYVADPYVQINSTYTTPASISIVKKQFKKVDYVRVDSSGTGYSSTSPAITIENPNSWVGIVSNVSLSSDTFKITPVPIPGSSDSVWDHVQVGMQVIANGIVGGTVVSSFDRNANLVTLSAPSVVATQTGRITTDKTGNIVATFSNVGLGYFASNIAVTISSPTGSSSTAANVRGVYLYGNGAVQAINLQSAGTGYTLPPTLTFTGGNTYTASATTTITLDLLDPTLVGSPVVALNDTWTFMSNVATGTYAVVTSDVKSSTTVTVDDTSMIDNGMIVSGGAQPISISNIIISTVPTRIITTVDAPFQTGDVVLIRGVTGTIELNNGRYYVLRVPGSNTAFDLYTSYNSATGVISTPQDSRNFTDYVSGGTLTSYTLDYSTVLVNKVLSPTQFTTVTPITIKAGTHLTFAGVPATAVARSDGNGIYSITVSNPGSGYVTRPNVSIVSSGGNQALGTAVMSHGVINYINVTAPGDGFVFSDKLGISIVSNVTLNTTQVSPYGSSVLYFDTPSSITAIQPGWLVFLVAPKSGSKYYTDFAQVPYATSDTTGPNSSTYQFYMDPSKTLARILTVQSKAGNTLVLSGPIDSRDSDGLTIDLPVGTEIYFTAQDIFFTQDGYGSTSPVTGTKKSTYLVATSVVESSAVKLETVMGVQPGMLMQDLVGSLPKDVCVVRVDAYLNTVYLSKNITAGAGLPVSFDTNASFNLTLNPAGVNYIEVTNPGSGYVRAPKVEIQPLSQVTKLASSLGTGANLVVNDFNGITIGANVTSTYDVNGLGVTAGSTEPVVTNFYTVQTGTNTFQRLVQLSYPQPAFSGILVTFTTAAQAVALISSTNTSFVAGDTTPETYDTGDTVTVNTPSAPNENLQLVSTTAYNQFYYTGVEWLPAQNKRTINQAPLFDAFDKNGNSAGDQMVYTASKFTGTQIFGYAVGKGANDTVLGFPLSYQNFQNVGDIKFTNFFQTDSFSYLNGFIEETVPIESFTLRQSTGAGSYLVRNVWSLIPLPTRQRQIINSQFDGNTNYFEIDVLPEPSTTLPNLLVFVGNQLVDSSLYTVEQLGGRYAVVIDTSVLTSVGIAVKIVVFSNSQSTLGYYEVPVNMDVNPMSQNFTNLTLGQVRNHLVTMTENHFGLEGPVLGSNNLRDVDTSGWQGTILQHASPITMASLFLTHPQLDAVKALTYAQKEYTKFKNRFLDASTKIELDIKDIPGSVDKLLSYVAAGKNKFSTWYDSDMVPYGTADLNVTNYQVLNIRQKTYLLPASYDPMVIQNRAVLVYLRDIITNTTRQLIVNIDFVFNVDTASITISDALQLAYNQVIAIYTYSNTTGNFVPPTPTKLGLYPKFVPEIAQDDTYRTPVTVIQGHDGSITPAFGDYRDDLLLELELRIYNNIKLDYEVEQSAVGAGIYDLIPGKFRPTGYTRTEFARLLTKSFLSWVGNSQLDYSTNTAFTSSDPFTWNYNRLSDPDGETLPGYWRGVYQYFYDTDRPHTHPWEMLGFAFKPDWWEGRYGTAPYTGANTLLWQDVEAGFVFAGPRQGIDIRFVRPGLSAYIPVDDNGNLLPPSRLMVSQFDSTTLSGSFAIGDQGPVETAWRRSSEFAFAVVLAGFIARPAFALSNLFDTSRFSHNNVLNQFLFKDTQSRPTPASYVVPDSGVTGNAVALTSGYINWVRDYLIYTGVKDPSALIRKLLAELNVKLSYKAAGFTDYKMLQITAEQSSPTGKGNNIIIPNENYNIHLQKGTAVRRLVYSAVIVESTVNGWKVSGYDATQPYFTIIPSQQNANNYGISVLNETATVYKDFQLRKVTVPYGYELTSVQGVVDFLVAYQRNLLRDGFTFNRYHTDLAERQDWILSAKEFMTWAQQGWNVGSVIILSPAGDRIDIATDSGTVDEITNDALGNKILDQNFTLIKLDNLTVSRIGNACTIRSALNQSIGLADLSLVEYEHALIFDNTTVFADVIYEPATGNRQSRLFLNGYKTGAWTGQLNAPGYIYNNGVVEEWVSRGSYGRGSLVSYKNQYYVAMQDVPESSEFDFTFWKLYDKTSIKTGLLPSLSNNADKFRNFYDVDNEPIDSNFDVYSSGLVGFRQRGYFQNFNLTNTSQVKFYQGFIKQKGTKNAISALTSGNFNNVQSDISFYEEWALRVGSYGSSGGSQFIEVVLNESTFTYDPSTFVFLPIDGAEYSGLINFNKNTIYRSSERYNPNIIQNRADIKPRISDNVTAGYVRLDDVDGTIYDVSEYATYSDLIKKIGAGFKLWVAVDFNKSWNVYRATETDVQLISINVQFGNRIFMSFSAPHGLTAGDFIAIKNFDLGYYDGFYVVSSVADGSNIYVTAYQSHQVLTQVKTATGAGILFRMVSVRYNNVTNILNFVPPHGWRNNDRTWIDNDTGASNWGVYQKTDGWQFNELLPLRRGDERFDAGYGKQLRINQTNQIVLAGTPAYSRGSVLGLRVVNPGANYQNPQVIISAPTGDNGILAQFLVNLTTGELVNPTVITGGHGYSIAPNVVVTDTYTTTTKSTTLNSFEVPIGGNIATNVYIGDTVTITSGNLNGITGTVTGVNISTPGTVTVSGNLTTNLVYTSLTNVPVYSGNINTNIVFNVNTANISLTSGLRVRAYGYGSINTYYDGTVSSYNATSVTMNVGAVVGSGPFTQYTLDFNLYLPASTGISFSRGQFGTVDAFLSPTQVEGIQIINGGSGFSQAPKIQIIGGGGTGATAVATITGGVIISITMTNGGSGYTSTPTVTLLTNNPVPVELVAKLKQTSVSTLKVTETGTGYRNPTLTLVSNTLDGGYGANVAITGLYANGGISGMTVTKAGAGYDASTSSIVFTNPGSGAGFAANVYLGLTSASIVNPGSGYGVGDVLQVVDGTVNGSQYGLIIVTGVTPVIGAVQSVRVITPGQYRILPSNLLSANTINYTGTMSGSGATFVLSYGVSNVAITNPGTNYTVSTTANIASTGGTGATATISRTNNGIGAFTSASVVNAGQGYLTPPTVKVIDNAGTGSGAIIEPIFPTGQVKTFLRPDQNSYGFEQTQTIVGFTNDAREFGSSIDIGTLYAVIGAPGSYSSTGAVLVAQCLGSQWISSQLLFASGLGANARFGQSVAISKDEQWIYVGAPGANSVYCYGKRSVAFGRDQVTPTVDAGGNGVTTYLTVFLGLQSANELTVLGQDGRAYEPNYDYTVDGAGNIVFADFARIQNQSSIYLVRQRLQTTIIPLQIRNVLQYTYPLSSQPDNIDQLLVYGSTGRVFVPNKEYTVVGGNITFLDNTFETEASIVVQQKDVYYQLVSVLTPPDNTNSDAQFGYSVRCDRQGYKVIVGAPNTTDTAIVGAGRSYVFSRSYDVQTTSGSQNIFTFPALNSAVAVTLDGQLLANNIDYVVSANTVTMTKVPRYGAQLRVDTNFFNIMQIIPCVSVVNQGRFGDSVEIAQDNKTLIISSPGYRDDTYYNGAVYRYVNKGLFYGTVSSSKSGADLVAVAGDTIKVNDTLVTFQKIAGDITVALNNFGSSALTAITVSTNAAGFLTLTINSGTALQYVDVIPGATGTALLDLGIEVYGLTQTLHHPRYGVPEVFGSIIRIDETGSTVAISSKGGNTLKTSTFDAIGTTFDRDTTRFIDSLNASGAVYIYDYLAPNTETFNDSGKLLYNQVLQNSYVLTGDNFGSAVDINKGIAIIGADASNYYSTKSGLVHVFVNPTNTKGWSRLRQRGNKVDLDYINQIMLYDTKSQTLLEKIDYYDPAKGKILGIADQDLDYKTIYDPASYNTATRADVTTSSSSVWGSTQVGQTWWNLGLCRYIDYEQGDLNYRGANWGHFFPGSTVEVLEWVESSYLPSQYAQFGGDGEAKYPDDSAYVTESYFNRTTGLSMTRYYFWVKNKKQFDRSRVNRHNSVVNLQNIIRDPMSQGVPYLAVLRSDAFNIYNVRGYLKSTDVALRVDYSRVITDVISHNEYELVQQGNELSKVPPKLISKLIDSLAGENSVGQVVPDLSLSAPDAYGISLLPRQSMVRDSLSAGRVFVNFVNQQLSMRPYVDLRNLYRFNLSEDFPPANVGFYHAQVDTADQLSYIPATELFVGYLVLVLVDSNFNNFWTIYRWDGDSIGFRMVRIQSYDTKRWWTYTDWYAEGYDQYTRIDFTVGRYVDTLSLNAVAGNIIKVSNDSNSRWALYIVNADLTLSKIARQSGTLQLNPSLYDYSLSFAGYDNAAFDQNGFSTTQSTELRNIVEGVVYDIFINEDAVQVNNLFFTMLNYILSEQPTVDWALKTSLISVLHKIRKLEQFPNYIVDNQDYYQSYINEVKPYRTQIRDYLLDYQGTDQVTAGMTDFDLTAVYDKNTSSFRTLNYKKPSDYAIITGSANNAWYKNFAYKIQSITLQNGGSGYTQAPAVTIVGGGGSGAVAEAVLGAPRLDGTASVAALYLHQSGAGYTSQPQIKFEGGNGTGAVASVVLQDTSSNVGIQTLNKTVRSILTTVKFDRISYTSSIRLWKPYEHYSPGTIIVIPDVRLSSFSGYADRQLPRFNYAYRTVSTLLGSSTLELNVLQDKTKLALIPASELASASDRLAAYNQPGSPDTATLTNSPDLVRFSNSPLNSLITSVANQWNAIAQSGLVPANHEYQFAAVGDRGLVALSKDGFTWAATSIADTSVNSRDVVFYNGDTWVVVANQGRMFYTVDGINWMTEIISSYHYNPTTDNLIGPAQNSVAQTLDATGVAWANATFSSLLLVVGNNGLILASPRGHTMITGLDASKWYRLNLQNYTSLPQNYLSVVTVPYGDLTDVDGTTYDVNLLPEIGYYATSTSGAGIHAVAQEGYVFTMGLNGAINMTSFLALDDVLQGYSNGYNYNNNGKAGDLNYPWVKMSVPTSVRGLGDGYTGEQISSLSVSGDQSGVNRWIVAVGSNGTLLWNKFDVSLRIRPGRASLGSATIGRTVVDTEIFAFDNFRYFDDSNFVAPLTQASLSGINFNQVHWDGQRFVVVGNNGLRLWGYPGTLPDAYIEIADSTNTPSVTSVRPSASWTNATPLVPITTITVVISGTDIDGGLIVPGMTAYAVGLPSGSVVQSTSFTGGLWNIVLTFASSLVKTNTASSITFSYVLTSAINAGATITATTGQTSTTATAISNSTGYITVTSTAGMQPGEPIVFFGTVFGSVVTSASTTTPLIAGHVYYIHAVIDSTHISISTTQHGDVATLTTASGSMTVQAGSQASTVTLTVSKNASMGATRLYISGFSEQVQANWRLSGAGIPAGAQIKLIGKFPSFQWKQATGNQYSNTLDYRALAVNDTLITVDNYLQKSAVPTYPVIDSTGSLTATVAGERALIAVDVAARQAANISIRAGDTITMFDPTGTRVQVIATQDLRSNVSLINIGIAGIESVAVGYRLEANAIMGIPDGTMITNTKNYSIGGVVSKLAKDIPDNIPGTAYTGTLVTGKAYTDNTTDSLNLDTTITSSYTDSLLGQRPEDIVINGGAFIDTYASHAPEELVPGQVIDSLQMTVFTANVLAGYVDFCDVITYKIFTDYQSPTVYYRMPAANTTVLAQDLYFANTSIRVTDISKLPDPNPEQNILGSVWIDGEKINYLGIDRETNLLLNIRRGANRTSIPEVHKAGQLVTDASSQQIIDQDSLLAITNDLIVYNGIAGTANSATYLAATTSSVPQGHIWQSDLNS